jgi:hypothetical protein
VSRPPCEFGDCDQPADYEFVGHWTIFDWLEVYACLVHVPRAISWLQRRTVDGQPVVEIDQHAFSSL